MILQNLGNIQLVYVDDYRSEYRKVLEKFGMAEPSGALKPYVRMSEASYTNDNGIVMPAIRITGHTVDLYVVNNTVSSEIHGAADLVNLLNYFPRAQYIINGHGFSGKFSVRSTWTVHDFSGRGITLNDSSLKDIAGIYDLMCHLDLNNGKLFEPVIAKYVYASRQLRRTKVDAIGYFDLHEYLAIVHSSKTALFFRLGKTNSEVYIKMKPERKLSVTIKSSENGVASIDITDMASVLDVGKVNSFLPYVILTTRPLQRVLGNEPGMKFPIQKAVFDKTTVFMTPVMTRPEGWEGMQGAIDLLQVTER